jgi:hypothetical protein
MLDDNASKATAATPISKLFGHGHRYAPASQLTPRLRVQSQLARLTAGGGHAPSRNSAFGE